MCQPLKDGIVGWAMRDHMRLELTIAALTMAIQRQKPPPGLIHHSDRGSQYAAAEHKLLGAAGMIQSMSRKGNCWDNAPMKSCFGTLKTELVHQACYKTRDAARHDLFAYIEGYYYPLATPRQSDYSWMRSWQLEYAIDQVKRREFVIAPTRCF
jgi:putative transposase